MSGSIIIPALVADHFSTRGEVAKSAEEARALGSDYGDRNTEAHLVEEETPFRDGKLAALYLDYMFPFGLGKLGQ